LLRRVRDGARPQKNRKPARRDSQGNRVRDGPEAAAVVGHGRRARALTVFVQLLSMPCEFTAVTAT